MPDPYQTLGVAPTASADDIKKAYRQLARELHPDVNPGDDRAEERFKEVAQAYELLSNPEARARYDQYGSGGGMNFGDPFGQGGMGGLGDLFDAFFGGGGPFGGGRQRGPSGPPRGPDLEVSAALDFTEAVFGCEHEVKIRTAISCEDCEGSGAAPGTTSETCSDCGGSGEQRVVRQSLLGQIVSTTVCRRCSGEGHVVASPCPNCSGEGRTVTERSYIVSIPGGVDQGSVLRLSGRGAVGARGGPSGDLYVKISVRPHDRFVRQGSDLIEELRVSMTQAALGHHLAYETLDGSEDLVIPKGTQTGRVFRLKRRGVPHGASRGDLMVHVVVVTPTDLTDDEEVILEDFATRRGEDIARPDTGLLSKIRSAFR